MNTKKFSLYIIKERFCKVNALMNNNLEKSKQEFSQRKIIF